MKNTHKRGIRLITLCLLLATVLSLAVACKPGDVGTVTDPQTQGDIPELDGLPQMDGNGYTFRITDFTSYPQGLESEPVTVVDNAIYKRNEIIKQRYNIGIETRTIPNWWDATPFAQQLAASETADYDLITIAINHTSRLVFDGDCVAACDMNRDYIDVSQPWHNQSLNESVTFDGVQLLDFTAFDVQPGGQHLIFNKSLIEELNLADPYQLVDAGSWTYDEMWKMAKAASFNLDNNPAWTDEDRYGLFSNYHMMTTVSHLGTGRRLVEIDESGMPKFNQSEGIVNTFINAMENMSVEGVYFDVFNEYGFGKGNETISVRFANDQCLFIWAGTDTLTSLGKMESGYGVLPLPKETVNQDRYYALSGSNLAMILTCHDDIEFVSIIKEALSIVSLKLYYPAYYENTLESRYLREEKDITYLKLITDSMVLELGAQFWADHFRNPIAENVVKNLSTNFASQFESMRTDANGVINELVTFVNSKK